jgi:hypothetical protein
LKIDGICDQKDEGNYEDSKLSGPPDQGCSEAIMEYFKRKQQETTVSTFREWLL